MNVDLHQKHSPPPPLYIGISFACLHLPYDLPDGEGPKKAQQEQEVNSSTAPSSTPQAVLATLPTMLHCPGCPGACTELGCTLVGSPLDDLCIGVFGFL